MPDSERTRVSHGRRLVAALDALREDGTIVNWQVGAVDPDGLGRLLYAIVLTPGDALMVAEMLERRA